MASPAGAAVIGGPPGPDKSFQHTLKGIIAGTLFDKPSLLAKNLIFFELPSPQVESLEALKSVLPFQPST